MVWTESYSEGLPFAVFLAFGSSGSATDAPMLTKPILIRHEGFSMVGEMFVGSGLFSWEPMSFNASRGNIYLDEENHTAMRIRNDGAADMLG